MRQVFLNARVYAKQKINLTRHKYDTSVLENEDYKILRAFSIRTDYVIEARRPDLVLVDNKERSCKVIDFAVPGDGRIEEKEKYIEKYHDLGRELQKT